MSQDNFILPYLPNTHISTHQTNISDSFNNLNIHEDDNKSSTSHIQYISSALNEISPLIDVTSPPIDMPLIHNNFQTDIDALETFKNGFRKRYNICTSSFTSKGLQEIIRQDICNESTQETNLPIVLYIHHDQAIACDTLPPAIFNLKSFTDKMKNQFVLFPWDFTRPDIKEYLIKYLQKLGFLTEILQNELSSRLCCFYIIKKFNGIYMVNKTINMFDNEKSILSKLNYCLNDYQDGKHDLGRQIAHFEDLCPIYCHSGKGDMTGDEGRHEWQCQFMRDLEYYKNIRETLFINYAMTGQLLNSSELHQLSPPYILISVKFPDNSSTTLEFDRDKPITELFKKLETLGYSHYSYNFFNSSTTNRNISKFARSLTFVSCGCQEKEEVNILFGGNSWRYKKPPPSLPI